MKPFNKEKFLLVLLGIIFAFQAVLFSAGFVYCAKSGGLASCPDISENFKQTFQVMIATTLALLTGSAVAGAAADGRKQDLAPPPEVTRASRFGPSKEPPDRKP